ncbi:MAG: outer membrane beta-barrel protein [Ghiorsea sp.]|nr:outer membrane beta-barrel protein [Ghiorsea sp.]
MKYLKMIAIVATVSCTGVSAHAEGFDSEVMLDGAKQLANDLKLSVGTGFFDFQAQANDQGSNLSANSAMYFFAIAEKDLDIELGYVKSAAQVRLGTSLNTAVNSNGTKVADANIGYMLSGLWKGSLEATDSASAYTIVGLSYAKTNTDVKGVGNHSNSVFGFTYGVGVDFNMDDALKIGAEYSFYQVQDQGPAPLTLLALTGSVVF